MTIRWLALSTLGITMSFSCLFCPKLNAAVIDAASASFLDVNNAVLRSLPGDTVQVPEGSASWGSTLFITHGITLKGSGIGKTVISSRINNVLSPLIQYRPTDPTLNEPFRLTGFTINGEWLSGGIDIDASGKRAVVDKIHIDNNRFVQCNTRAVHINGLVYGLINSCFFYSCNQPIGVDGGIGRPWYAWEDLPMEFGTENQFFIEDNYFEGVPNQKYHNYVVMAGDGGRYVFRYNSVVNHDDFEFLDMHGNQNPVTPANQPGGSRSTMCVEIYENNFTTNYSTGQRLIYIRGGSSLIFNNTLTGSTPYVKIELTEEDGWRFAFVGGPPAYDTISNTYFWNNTNNGVLIVPNLLDPTDAAYIQEGTQYFLFPKPGYTPYVYPHPLSGNSPYEPQHLRIKQ